MTKKMLIDASHPEETRVVVLDGNRLEDFDLEAANRLPLKGNIYLAKVVRVEPSLQAAFVEYGGNRHGFLPLAEIHPDYYQIPVADRQRLLEMQAAEAREEEAAEEAEAASERAEAEGVGAEPDRAEAPADDATTEAAAETAAEAAAAGRDDDDAGREAEAGRAGGGSEAPADAPAEAAPSPRDEEPEPVLVAPPVLVAEAVSEAEPAQPADGDAPQAAAENAAPATTGAAPDGATPGVATEDTAPVPESAASDVPDAAAAGPAPSGDEATIAEQSGPFLLPGEGEQPSVGPVAARAAAPAPNGHADDFERDDAPPPEDIGGEGPEEVARERRGSARFMRHYKIQEVIKRRQIMLVQVVKEERGTKGAALTTFISLAGRFSVLMPNSPRGGGVSRKITSATDRRRLREVIDELELPDGMSLIVRTAGAQRPKPEIRRDCEYLLRLWDNIRERTLSSTAPALIYEEADLIKRSIRDNYARDVEEILVDGEDAYREAREFMRMLMPQHAQKIQLHRDGGLFARHGVEAQLDAMHSPVVQLRSGGYVVINQTEALVSIDVNSGRSTRERHIEDTAFRTNMEAADEIARQLRLRDLAGLIVIDFIDMESNRHDATVERRLKEALRHDRARIQVGRISHFGLLEMSRQRLRPSLAETAFVPCPHCHGIGQVRSLESGALSVLRAIEEEGAKRRAAEIAVHVAGPVALYLLNRKRDRLARIEQRFGMSVVFEPDDSLQPPALRIDRLRVADPGRQRPVEAPPSALRMDYAPEPEEDDEEEAPEAAAAPLDSADEDAPEGRANGRAAAEAGSAEERAEEGRRRRRRRRRRGGRGDEADSAAASAEFEDGGEAGDEAPAEFGASPPEAAEAGPGAGAAAPPDAAPLDAAVPEDGQADSGAPADEDGPAASDAASGEAPRRRRRRRGGGRSGVPARADQDGADAPPSFAPAQSGAAEPPPAPRYSGPTPADPFAGHVDDIMAAMEAAEAAAEAAAQATATPGRRAAARTAPPPPPPPPPPEVAEPAPQQHPAPATDAVEASPDGAAPPRAGEEPAPVVAAASEAPAPAAPPPPAAPAPTRPEPALAAAAPEPPAAAEPVQGPPVRPRSVDEVAADAPRRSGWWKR